MRDLSVTFKLWLAFAALVLAALLPPSIALSRLLTGFYHHQVTDPLVYHTRRLAEMVAMGSAGLAMAPMMGQMVGAEVQVVDAEGRPVAFPGAGRTPLDPALVHRALQGESFVVHARLPAVGAADRAADRSAYLVSAAPVGNPQAPTGAAFLLVPASPLEEALTGARRLLLLTLAGTGLLAAAAAILLSRTLVQPLWQMEQATQAMARGDYQARVPLTGSDEIGRLAAAINTLAASLQRYDRTRREFLANVAHELRTPLSYLRGYSQALAEGMVQDEEDRRRYLQIIQEESARLARLVDDLMDLAAMEEGGRAVLRLAPLDPAVPIAQAVGALQPSAQAKGVHLALSLPPQLPQVLADGARVQQVVLNLLDNALRHTPSGGTVTVAATADGRQVRVTVSDTGPGIPPEELEAIWDRFHKVDRSRSGGGRGLGLAIVRSIVRAHGGDVGAVSSPGGGSTFWFTVPVASGSPETDTRAE